MNIEEALDTYEKYSYIAQSAAQTLSTEEAEKIVNILEEAKNVCLSQPDEDKLMILLKMQAINLKIALKIQNQIINN